MFRLAILYKQTKKLRGYSDDTKYSGYEYKARTSKRDPSSTLCYTGLTFF